MSEFLGIRPDPAQWAGIVERCTFEGMRKAGGRLGDFERAFEGGAEGFIFKGTNGRWRDVLDADDLAAYQRKVAEMLPQDAARWIESGGPVVAH